MTQSVRYAALLLATAIAGCSELANPTLPSTDGPAMAPPSAGGGDLPVTSFVADHDATVAPTLQIRSDGLGSYPNSSALTSVVQNIGAWVLDGYNPKKATRRVYLDFAQPIPGSGPNGGNPIAIPSGLYKMYIISKCNAYGNSMLTLAPGASIPCPLHLTFDSGGSTYALQMNPYPTGADPDGAPETNYANVTCEFPSSGSGPCARWRFAPSATDGRNVARLIKKVSSRGSTTNVNQGNFYLSFSLRVTKP